MTPYIPDAANGALLYALIGGIPLPTDSDAVRGAMVRTPCENILDVLYYLSTGPAGDPDFKITGNGAPPAAGYTVTTRPVEIKGQGLKLTSAPLDFGSGATLTGTVTMPGSLVPTGSAALILKRRAVLPFISTTITTAADVYRQAGGMAGALGHTVKSTSPTPPDGAAIRVVKKITAYDVALLREDATEIATMPAASFVSADLLYDSTVGEWILTGGINLDLSTAIPIP